mmetsp:Transcript_34812/g.42934  ORF Transcript_34812/g.42934 Transcript_34812/m.42934 type:complete len:414 (-) Transcript_34812:284-1525(-)
MLWSVALQLVGVGGLGHQIQSTIAQLIEKRRRTANTRSAATGPTQAASLFHARLEHHIQQLGQLRSLKPQTILRDHESKFIPRRLNCEFHHHVVTRPHVPMLVRQVNVPLLGDGEGSQPSCEERDLPRFLLPNDLVDAFRGPPLHRGVPPGDHWSLTDQHMTGDLVVDLAWGSDRSAGRGVLGVGIGQFHQLLARCWYLSNGPALDLFAEGRNGQQIHPNHSSDGHLDRIFAGTVEGGIQRSNANAMAYGLQLDGFWEIQSYLDLAMLNGFGAEAFALQVAPEANLHLIIGIAPLQIDLQVRIRFLFLDVQQQMRCGSIDQLHLQGPNLPDVVHAPVLAGHVALLAGLAVQLQEITHHLFCGFALLNGRLHGFSVRSLFTHHGNIGGDLILIHHVWSGCARNKLLPFDLVLQL